MYDLLILAINEEKASRICTDKIRVKAINKTGIEKQKYYCEIWPFINNVYGILYKIFSDRGLGDFECCDEMFEFGTVSDIDFTLSRQFPNLQDESFEDCVSMKLVDDYDSEFISALDILLSCSPISTVAFLCRGQSLDKEIILGTLSLSDFSKMLHLGQIRTNICYIISNYDGVEEQ